MDMPIRLRPTEGQLALAERLVAGGDEPDGADTAAIAASVYTDPARLAGEQARIFRRLPQVIAPSALLPGPNMAVPHDGFGTPLLLTRDRQGARTSSTTSAATGARGWSKAARRSPRRGSSAPITPGATSSTAASPACPGPTPSPASTARPTACPNCPRPKQAA